MAMNEINYKDILMNGPPKTFIVIPREMGSFTIYRWKNNKFTTIDLYNDDLLYNDSIMGEYKLFIKGCSEIKLENL